MGLDKNFPREPIQIIDPSLRYIRSNIGEKGRKTFTTFGK